MWFGSGTLPHVKGLSKFEGARIGLGVDASGKVDLLRYSSRLKNNYFAEM